MGRRGRDRRARRRRRAPPGFAARGLPISPINLPTSDATPRAFTELARSSAFEGLPGVIADSLPDRFGNALIDAWLATQGRTADSFNAVERLCYTGSRGMGRAIREQHVAQAMTASTGLRYLDAASVRS